MSRYNFRSILSLPFRLIRRISNWFLNDLPEPGSLEQRFPLADFQPSKNISVGERVFIGAGCLFIAKTKIVIGNDTMIAPRVFVTTSTHDPQQNPMWKIAIFRPVEIGNSVWIGLGAIILPGVKIGDHAIIGAGAVVSKHVPERAVVVGSPARIVRYREVMELDTAVQAKYPYWEDNFEDYLPAEQVTKTLDGE